MQLDPRLLKQVHSTRLALPMTVGFGFVGGLLVVLQARLLSRIINLVFLRSQSLGDVANLLGILLFIIFLRAIVIWATEISASSIAARVKHTLRTRLFDHILSLGPAYVRGERAGELTHVVVEGIESLDAYFSQYLPQLVLASLVPLIILVFIFPFDSLSAVIFLLTAPLIPFFMILIGNLANTVTQKQWQTLSRMNAYFLDVLQGLSTLKAFGRSREQIRVIALIGERYREVTMKVLRVAFLSALVMEFISTLSTALVAVEIGLRLLYNTSGVAGITFEKALFILILAPEFYLPLRLLGTRFHAAIAGVTAAQRIFQILDESITISWLPTESVQKAEVHPLPEPLVSCPSSVGDIRFRDVCYTYPGDRPALKGVSFDIRAGQKLALVGPTGAGKSTVAHLLLRFLKPDTGYIEVGGIPVEKISPEEWRVLITWVSQDPYLFNDTVSANIRMAKASATQEEVFQAARQAHLHDFILTLPNGYDTLIGERGARLSGGQAQRLALARAFLKDAPLFIMDEATAFLDPHIQTDLLESLGRFLVGRTALIIAHRLKTVSSVDQILVMAEGKIVETGNHQSLLKQDGLYRKLVLSQVGE